MSFKPDIFPGSEHDIFPGSVNNGYFSRLRFRFDRFKPEFEPGIFTGLKPEFFFGLKPGFKTAVMKLGKYQV